MFKSNAVGFGLVVGLGLALAGGCPSSAADDSASPEVQSSNDLMALFTQACTTNLGRPEGVKAWAADHQLASIQDPQAIAVYGGEGGSVWSVRAPSGVLALALRGASQACAVFGDKLDSGLVEKSVRQIVDQMKAAGAPVTILKDDNAQTDFGRRHGIVYAIGDNRPKLLMLNVITNERPGGAYQATVQIAASGGSSTPP
jgi:hypothetical protein